MTPRPHRPARHRTTPGLPVSVLTAINPVLRELLVGGLLLDVTGAVELRYTTDREDGALRRQVVALDGVREDVEVELGHPCVSCAMREDALPTLDRLAAATGITAVLLTPPLTAEPEVVAGTLLPGQGTWHLASAVAVLGAERAREDLLGDATLAERGLGWGGGDQRAVGEALAAQLEYADVIVLDGAHETGHEAEAGRELVEHLRSAEQLLLPSVHEVAPSVVLGGRLDHPEAAARRDVRAVRAHGGPTVHGTWTLELRSERPFHPGRFLDNIEDLGSGRLRSRGRFWVPDRPSTVCQWDGAGGQVSVGAVADTGAELPDTHLVVTGVAPEDAPRVREAFARSLLTPQEWEEGLAVWLGADDPLAPWLGRREVTGSC